MVKLGNTSPQWPWPKCTETGGVWLWVRPPLDENACGDPMHSYSVGSQGGVPAVVQEARVQAGTSDCLDPRVVEFFHSDQDRWLS
jgi:hypothetical protein